LGILSFWSSFFIYKFKIFAFSFQTKYLNDHSVFNVCLDQQAKNVAFLGISSYEGIKEAYMTAKSKLSEILSGNFNCFNFKSMVFCSLDIFSLPVCFSRNGNTPYAVSIGHTQQNKFIPVL